MTTFKQKQRLPNCCIHKRFVYVMTLLFCLLVPSLLIAQDKTISGTVTDETGSPLPGANILQRGTSNGVVTDFDGKYSITLVSDGDNTLIFSFVGFVSKQIAVGSDTTISVSLQEDSAVLDEVVVVGYGTQKKVNLTGAVDVVSSEVLADRAIVNVGQGLQGVIPNLNITVTSGDPTDSPDFNIRGFESINGGSPLILVDGVPMDLNRINPEDIRTLTVLKDGAAAAIYGARAAFGVILVETKGGQLGRMNVQFNTQLSWNKPIFKVDPIDNGYTYALERNKVFTRNGGDPTYDDAYLEGLRLYWSDPENNPGFEVVEGNFRNYTYPALAESLVNTTSPRQKFDLSISGATEKANYYTSIGFFNTDGFWNHPANDNFKRYNILTKADFKIKDWITFQSQVTGNFETSDKPGAVDINTLIRIEPIRPYIVPRIEGFEEFEGQNWAHAFPIFAELDNGGREIFTNQDIWLKSGVVLNPVKNLTITSNFSYNVFNRQFERARPQYELVSLDIGQDNPRVIRGDNTIESIRNYDQYYVFNAYAEYVLDQLDDHYFKFMGGFNQEWDFNTRLRGFANTLISPDLIDIGATTGTQITEGGKSQATLRGVFYRINYNYKEKYLLEASTRYDGTSRFPKKDRFGIFPSISAGWRISKEKFMQSTEDWLSNLKIRASYGELGNQLLGNNFYPYIPSLGTGNSNFVLNSGFTSFVNPPGLVSPTLTWETVRSKNIGIDIDLFQNRFNMSFDAYTRETLDMLLRREYPNILGSQAPQENGADLRTKGWELSVKWRDDITQDLNYYVNVNLSDWTSEITKYDNPTGAIDEFYVGQQLGEIWGYETVGIIQDEEQLAGIADQSRLGNNWIVGDLEFADLDGNGEISDGTNTLDDPGDRRIIGNTTPRYSYGINAGIQYKGFGLDLLFQGVGKRDYYPSRGNWTWFFPWRAYNGDKSWIRDSWTPENRDAYFPEAQQDNKNFVEQTRFLQDASYIRLKNVNISYTLPSKLTQKMGIGGLKIFVAGQNVWEYSKIREPLDPEYIFDNSIDYPLLRTYTIGLNVNL